MQPCVQWAIGECLRYWSSTIHLLLCGGWKKKNCGCSHSPAPTHISNNTQLILSTLKWNDKRIYQFYHPVLDNHLTPNLFHWHKYPLLVLSIMSGSNGSFPPKIKWFMIVGYKICVINLYSTCARWRQNCRFLALRVLDWRECDAEKQMARYCWYCHAGQPLSVHFWSASQAKRAVGFGFWPKCGFLKAGIYVLWMNIQYLRMSLFKTKIHCFASDLF